MARNIQHDLLSSHTPEAAARQRFVLAFKKQTEQLRRKSRLIYDSRIISKIEDKPGQEDAVVKALYEDDIYQTLSSLKYIGQTRMWSAISSSVLDNAEKMSRDFERLSDPSTTIGSLKLNPEADLPDEFKKVHVHLQPGGYLTDLADNDVLAGAYYEEGGALYSQGQSVGTRESKAECLMRFLRQWKPDFTPGHILDMGCSVGASSVPYALEYPEADVHAIDIAPAMLRYAHARAESIGAKVHFSQQDVTGTEFEDESFDLIVSHNAMHEMSAETQQAMFNESYRMLKPGGICLHQDLPLDYSKLDTFEKVELSYDKWFNGELYWRDYAESDCASMFEKAGFDKTKGYFGLIDQSDNSMRWFVAAAVKT